MPPVTLPRAHGNVRLVRAVVHVSDNDVQPGSGGQIQKRHGIRPAGAGHQDFVGRAQPPIKERAGETGERVEGAERFEGHYFDVMACTPSQSGGGGTSKNRRHRWM